MATPRVRPHSGWRLPTPPSLGGLLGGPRPLPCWCSGPSVEYEWAFAFVLLEYAFLIAHFGVFSLVALQNMYILKLMENVSYKALL